MKILLVSSVALHTPPLNYGGLERVVYEYAQGLSKRGHEVTLAAAKDSPYNSESDYKFISTVPSWDTLNNEERNEHAKADRKKMDDGELSGSMWNAWRVQEEKTNEFYKGLLHEFDVIGDHSWAKWTYMSDKQEIIGTLHSIQQYQRPPRGPYRMLACVSNGHARSVSKQLAVPVRKMWNPVESQ